MIGQSLFREQAVANRGQRERLDHLLKVTAPNERVFLAAIGAIVAALLGWLVFGTVSRTLSAEGILVTGSRHAVVSHIDGWLGAWLVAPGDRVEAGVPVAQLAFPVLDARIAALRDRVSAMENTGTNGSDDGALALSLSATRLALLELEADRIARETVVSPAAGELVALRPAAGQRIRASDEIAAVRTTEQRRGEVLVRISGRRAEEIKPGMLAMVTAILPEGARRAFTASVANVSPPLVPERPERSAPDDPTQRLGQVRLLLDGGESLRLPEGAPVQVKVVLERKSPAALLGLARS